MSLVVRREWGEDRPAIRAILERAFPTAAEADLVDALRAKATGRVSLVAWLEDEQCLVGQIQFTPVALGEVAAEDSGAMGLAPMAVVPGKQRQGIGSALVRAGLQHCFEVGGSSVVVLGHADYYARFGFRPAWDFGLYYGEPGPNPAFRARELVAGALDPHSGPVSFHTAFDAL